ncbi:Site-specific recombinase XerD [Sphingomonas gellani]|uniref:Site-specific recombinase XerD n=1 Tax=Sphingomonas gellani TaxID=1166340 RepID=A0A1H7Z5U1_9SPHN|nr:site-specific integrase [Sphingomonas gellani]SEM53972.1 Site-specific recombinase XerD [Sphingomonas gellani]
MASVKKREGYGYEVRYIDPATGKRPSKTFQLKKDAEAYKRKVEREIEDGVHVGRASTKTVNEVCAEFLADCEVRRRDGRIGEGHSRRHDMVCRRYIGPAFGTTAARDLTVRQVSDLYASMIGGGVHPRSAKQYLSTLQLVEKFARKHGYLKAQPVADAMMDLRGIPAFKVETFAPAEVTHLLAAVHKRIHGRRRRSTAFMACCISLAALCGLRVGEVLGLKASNLDLDRRVLRVRHNLTAYRELKGPKTAAGIRDVPIPEPVAAELIRWRDDLSVANDGGYFFTREDGRPYEYGAVHESWKRLLVREALPPRHFHALRHFYASWLLRHGMPVADVSKMIGHSSHDMTLRVYTHALLESDEAISQVDRIAGLLPANDASKCLSVTQG